MTEVPINYEFLQQGYCWNDFSGKYFKAVGFCFDCDKPLCQKCIFSMNNGNYCSECIEKRVLF